MQKLLVLIFVCLLITVEGHQREADKVYQRLSDKMYYDISLVRREHVNQITEIRGRLSKMDEKLDSVYSELNDKINSIGAKLTEKMTDLVNSESKKYIAPIQTEKSFSKARGGETLKDSQLGNFDNDQNNIVDFHQDIIKDQINILRLAFKKEKMNLRNLVLQTQSYSEIMASLDDRVTRNEEKVVRHEKELRAIEEYIKMLEGRLKEIPDTQDNITVLELNVEQLINQQSLLEKKLEERQGSSGGLVVKNEERRVAFSVFISKTTKPLPIGSTIVFDVVGYAEGGGYNSEDGIFTCPVTGVYLFSVVVQNGEIYNEFMKMTVRLMVDNKSVAYLISEEYHVHQYDQSSNLVVTRVNRGQEVRVQVYQFANVSFWGEFCTFSGVLLYT